MDNIFYSLTVLIFLKNGEFVIFNFWKVRLKPRYFTSSLCDFYENWHVLPRNIVPTYSSIFLNLKVWLSRKCKNKIVGVRKVVRYIFSRSSRYLEIVLKASIRSCHFSFVRHQIYIYFKKFSNK